MSTTIRYLSAFGIVLVLALTLGVPVSRAAGSDFGAVRVDRDLMTYHPGFANEYWEDMATNSTSGERDADLEKHKPLPFSWGVGVCGQSQTGVRCRRGSM